MTDGREWIAEAEAFAQAFRGGWASTQVPVEDLHRQAMTLSESLAWRRVAAPPPQPAEDFRRFEDLLGTVLAMLQNLLDGKTMSEDREWFADAVEGLLGWQAPATAAPSRLN